PRELADELNVSTRFISDLIRAGKLDVHEHKYSEHIGITKDSADWIRWVLALAKAGVEADAAWRAASNGRWFEVLSPKRWAIWAVATFGTFAVMEAEAIAKREEDKPSETLSRQVWRLGGTEPGNEKARRFVFIPLLFAWCLYQFVHFGCAKWHFPWLSRGIRRLAGKTS